MLLGVAINPGTTPIGRPCLGAIGFTSTLQRELLDDTGIDNDYNTNNIPLK